MKWKIEITSGQRKSIENKIKNLKTDKYGQRSSGIEIYVFPNNSCGH
jgi:hypothetical protein